MIWLVVIHILHGTVGRFCRSKLVEDSACEYGVVGQANSAPEANYVDLQLYPLSTNTNRDHRCLWLDGGGGTANVLGHHLVQRHCLACCVVLWDLECCIVVGLSCVHDVDVMTGNWAKPDCICSFKGQSA